MKRHFYFLFLVFLMNHYVSRAQSDSSRINRIDSIFIDKKWYGTTFIQNGETLKIGKLSDIMKQNPETGALMKRAEIYYTTSFIFAFSGGALIGWPVGTALAGGEPKWGMVGIGGALVAISFIFESLSMKYITKAIDIYNKNSPILYKMNIQMGMLDTGVGIRINF